MNTHEQPRENPKKPADSNKELPTEQIRKVEDEITKNTAMGNFDEVLRLSRERDRLQQEEEKRKKDKARKEALPGELRTSIDGIKKRIKEIEDGKIDLSPPLKEEILDNLNERLEIQKEDLLIAEGQKPDYEIQIEELKQELEDVKEKYARRWEELTESGDETRIMAFLGDVPRNSLDNLNRSAYESAKWNAEVSLKQHLDYASGPRSVRNIYLFVKNKLKEALSRSERV